MSAALSISVRPSVHGREDIMGKLKKEGCPRCKKGVIALEKDWYGWYEYCLQCGYERDLPDLPKFNKVAVKVR
jgi:ribosomal protein S27AE